MEQLKKKQKKEKKEKTQIQVTTWLAKPGAVPLSQHRARRQKHPCPSWWPCEGISAECSVFSAGQ
jgi:hypothetical protein